ncbi:MAG: winged helix DNA-binding domain-containing protein [Desertimonas sp.]
MEPVRVVSIDERRARLGRRHAIRPTGRVATVEDAVAAMGCFHATESSTIYLSGVARVDGLTVGDVDRALYTERTLIRQMAMRRTLFVFPRDALAAALGSASARVAAEQRRTLVRDVEQSGLVVDGAGWLAAAERAVLDALGDGRAASTTELRAELTEIQGDMEHGTGRSWHGRSSFGPRVLTALSAAGSVVRGPVDGHWRAARPRWVVPGTWLVETPVPASEREGYARLVDIWLHTFGPGTEHDVAWWLGSTLGAVRTALADIGAVAVQLDGATGWLAADDVEPVEAPEPWVALLPTLDPTTMGWKTRDWYLGEHGPDLFDRAGNGGATAWCDGRIVGGWYQDEDATVVVATLEDVGADVRAALDAEAERLTTWLAGVRVNSIYASPVSRRLAQRT